jgi:hypothetical protein
MPEPTLPELALYLARNMDRLRQHEAAADICREVTAAVRHATRVIDRPPQRVYAGPCDCGRDLLTKPGRTLVSCPACGATYDIQARVEWMRSELHDYLVTATEAADEWLPAIGIRVASGTIRVWASRHRLERWPGIPRFPGDLDAPPRYRVGDIAALALARDTPVARLALTCAGDLLLRMVHITSLEVAHNTWAIRIPGATMHGFGNSGGQVGHPPIFPQPLHGPRLRPTPATW